MATNFKLGTQMEHEDTDTDKRHKLQGQRSKSQGNVLRLSVWQVLAHKSRNKSRRSTKIGRKVAHPTRYNAHQFQGHKAKGHGQQVN